MSRKRWKLIPEQNKPILALFPALLEGSRSVQESKWLIGQECEVTMTDLEAVARSKRLLKEMKENPHSITTENYPIHGSLYEDAERITPEFLMEAIAEHERMEKSGELRERISRSVRSIPKSLYEEK